MNIIIYYLSAHIVGLKTVESTCIAWICAVLFAYMTNRKWVFESMASNRIEIFSELMKFFSCRFVTGIMDIGIMYLFADLMGLNDIIVKTLSNILVIILNYIASKFLVFKKK